MIANQPDVSQASAEIADRLEAAGLGEAAAKVRSAARAADTDPLLAETLLREAADGIMELSPAYSRWIKSR